MAMDKDMREKTIARTDEEEVVIDLRRLVQDMWQIFQTIWWVVLLGAMLSPVIICLYLHVTYEPIYEAYTSLTVKVVSRSTSDETNTVYNFYYDREATAQLDKTFSYIISSDRMKDEIKVLLGTDSINGKISAESVKETNLFIVHVYSSEPEDAKEILEAVIAVYPEVVRFVIGEIELDIVEEPVIMPEPYNKPDYPKYALWGMIFGVFMACGIILLVAVFRKTVKSPEDIKANINIPCIGMLPKVADKKRNAQDSLFSILDERTDSSSDRFAEETRSMVLKIDNIMQKKHSKVLLITSTLPVEGKSMVALNIAQAMAGRGKKVLLLDGDLRKPVLFKRFSLPEEFATIQDVLDRKKTLKEALYYISKEGIFYLGNNKGSEKPAKLIGSERMKKLLASLKESVDYIIIDAPPCEMMTDVEIYWEYVDAAIYIVRSEWASTGRIVRAIRELTRNENKIIGFVLNAVDCNEYGYGKYGYGKYGYGKYGYGKTENDKKDRD